MMERDPNLFLNMLWALCGLTILYVISVTILGIKIVKIVEDAESRAAKERELLLDRIQSPTAREFTHLQAEKADLAQPRPARTPSIEDRIRAHPRVSGRELVFDHANRTVWVMSGPPGDENGEPIQFAELIRDDASL